MKITQNNAKGLQHDNSILKVLVEETIKNTDKKLEDLLEQDGKTLLVFEIRYEAPILFEDKPQPQRTEIIQYGLFRALDTALQSSILKNELSYINIVYKLDDPIFIEFLMDSKRIQAPPLLTKMRDKRWKRAD